MSLDFSLQALRPVSVFKWNITHNLGAMARAAGVGCLWHPEEVPGKPSEGESKDVPAGRLIPLLEQGLARLKRRPAHFKKFNPENGWGTYENLVEFVEKALAACRQDPEAIVSVWR